jgi:hypothetical protein
VAEAHEALAPRDLLAQHALGALGRAVPISNTMSSAGPGAPPCSGPLSAPTAPAIADTKSEPVEVMTRAVNVEAFKP